MVQFLRLHASDLDFQATVIKARQFADATGQSKPKKRVNFIDNRPRSPSQPEWEPLLQGFRDMMTEALQPLQRALRSQGQASASSSFSTAPAPPQSRPASPHLNSPPRGAWQNRPQWNRQAPRPGNANQPPAPPRTFPQPQGQRGTDNRPRTPPTFQRHQRQFRPRPATLPGPARQPRQGCFVCGVFGCHTVIHERNGTLPPNFRRASTSGGNDRSGSNNNNSRLNANARVFTPSPKGQRRSPTGNSCGKPGTGNRVPPLQRPSSA